MIDPLPDWSRDVALLIDSLHAMTPTDRDIVREWLAKQDRSDQARLTAERCAIEGGKAVAAEMGISVNALYTRLAKAGASIQGANRRRVKGAQR